MHLVKRSPPPIASAHAVDRHTPGSATRRTPPKHLPSAENSPGSPAVSPIAPQTPDALFPRDHSAPFLATPLAAAFAAPGASHVPRPPSPPGAEARVRRSSDLRTTPAPPRRRMSAQSFHPTPGSRFVPFVSSVLSDGADAGSPRPRTADTTLTPPHAHAGGSRLSTPSSLSASGHLHKSWGSPVMLDDDRMVLLALYGSGRIEPSPRGSAEGVHAAHWEVGLATAGGGGDSPPVGGGFGWLIVAPCGSGARQSAGRARDTPAPAGLF